MQTINIKVLDNGTITPSSFKLGNQYEHLDTKLVFNIPNEEYNNMNKYVIFTHEKYRSPLSNIIDCTKIYPIPNNEVIITNNITRLSGMWKIIIMCRQHELDLSTEIVDVNAQENEKVFVSDVIDSYITNAPFDKEELENIEFDENFQIIYDDLLALKKELETVIENGGSGGGITDVTINDTSIVTDGVAKIPVASTKKLGLVQTRNEHGMMISEDGYVYPIPATDAQIDSRTNYKWITAKNTDYLVKSALCDGKGEAYTEEEKAKAKERLGVKDIQHNVVQGYFDEERIPSTYSVANAWTTIEVYNGFLNTRRATAYHINNRGKEANKACLMPEELDIAVKAAMCDGKGAEWTTTEKASAKERMGIDKDLELLSIAIEGKTTSPYINSNGKTNLTDSDKGLLKNIDVRGKTEQVQYTGKNLIDWSKLSDVSSGGATITNNGDGSFTIGGSGNMTANLYSLYSLNHEETLSLLQGDYLSLQCEASYPYINVIIKNNGSAVCNLDSKNGGLKVVTVKGEWREYTSLVTEIFFYGISGNAIVSKTIKPMLFNGNTETEYEPYVGGIPSPNIDYPQEMVSSNKLDITVCGRNMFNPKWMKSKTGSGVTVTNNDDGSFTLTGTCTQNGIILSDKFSLQEGTYILKDFLTGTLPNESGARTQLYSPTTKSNLALYNTNSPTASSQATMLASDDYQFRFRVVAGHTYNCTFKPMLFISGGVDFEPYQEQVVSYELPISMKSTLDGKYYDYIDLDRGKLVQVMKEIVFDETELNKLYGIYSATVYGRENAKYVVYTGTKDNIAYTSTRDAYVSDKLGKCMSIANDYFTYFAASQMNIIVPDDATMDNVKATILGAKLLYPLATPIEHDLSSELVEQLKVLYTYYGVTNIDSSLPIKFDYKLNLPSWYNVVSKTVTETRTIIYDMETQTLQNSIDTAYTMMLVEEGAI